MSLPHADRSLDCRGMRYPVPILIPEAKLIGGASLIDYAIRARGTLTF